MSGQKIVEGGRGRAVVSILGRRLALDNLLQFLFFFLICFDYLACLSFLIFISFYYIHVEDILTNPLPSCVLLGCWGHLVRIMWVIFSALFTCFLTCLEGCATRLSGVSCK